MKVIYANTAISYGATMAIIKYLMTMSHRPSKMTLDAILRSKKSQKLVNALHDIMCNDNHLCTRFT